MNEETANETEVEAQEKTIEESPELPTTTENEKEEKAEEEEEPKPPEMIDQASQAAVERRNAKTETSCGLVGATGLSESISAKGLPILVDSIKNAFIDGGYDPRAWDQMTLDATPVANFADVLYIQVHFLKEFKTYKTNLKRAFWTQHAARIARASGRVLMLAMSMIRRLSFSMR